jgi:translation initiation factor eIF-2B subunit epsilon
MKMTLMERRTRLRMVRVPVETALMIARRLKILGPNTCGYIWPQEEEEAPDNESDDGEPEDPYEHPRNKRLLQLGRTLSNLTASTVSLSTLSKASSSPPDTPVSLASSTSLPDIPTLSLDSGPPPAFHAEASASLERAYEEDHAIENAMLELRTLVMGYNAGIDRAREEVVNFLLSKVDLEGGAAQVLASAVKIWARWGKLAEGLSPDPTNIALDIQVHFCYSHN